MKVVLDTNIWVSSLLLPHSIPGQIIKAWRQTQFDIAISTPILEEIEKALEYPKIKKRLTLASAEIEEYLTFILLFTENVEIKSDFTCYANEVRDKNDGCILATFIESKSNYLITGDQGLLALDKKHSIITPSAFVKHLA